MGRINLCFARWHPASPACWSSLQVEHTEMGLPCRTAGGLMRLHGGTKRQVLLGVD